MSFSLKKKKRKEKKENGLAIELFHMMYRIGSHALG